MDGEIKVKIGADVTDLNAGLKSATVTIGGLEAALKDLKSQLRDASGQDILKFNQQIKGVEDALKQAKSAGLEPAVGAFGEVSKAAGFAYNEVRKLAYILPGIGVGGLFGILFSGIESIFQKTTEASDQAKKAAQDAQKAIEQVTQGFAKEGAQVESLVTSLQRGNLSHLQAKTAIEELQKISPEYFGNLDKEHLSIEQLTKDYNAYNASIVNAIETQLKLKDVTDLIQQRLDFEKSAKDASAEFNTLIAQGKSLADIAKLANDRIQEQAKSNIDLLQSEKGRFANAQALAGGLAVEATALLKIVQLRQQEADILATVTNFGKEKLKDVQGEAQAVTIIAKVRINPDLAALPDALEQDEDRLAKALKPIEDRINKQFEKLPTVKIKLPKIDADTKEVDAMAKKISDALKTAFSQTFEALGEGLGDVLSGKGLNSFTQNLGKILGEALKNIGKILIQFAAEKIIIDKALALLGSNPYVALAAGIAAIALGQVIENQATNAVAGATKFAQGGVVTGPTLGLVGEAGPEVIFPLEKLNQFIKKANTSNNVNVGGRLTIQGTDLVTVINRTNKNQGLV